MFVARILIVYFALILTAPAYAAPANQPQILSASQLMKLSPKRRLIYLQGLRQIVHGLEFQMRYKLIASDDRNAKEFVALIELMMPRAFAAASEIEATLVSGDYPIKIGNDWVCRSSGLEFIERIATCTRGTALYQECPVKTDVSVYPTDDNKKGHYCVPNSSWIALDDKHKGDLKKRNLWGKEVASPSLKLHPWIIKLNKTFGDGVADPKIVLGGLSEDKRARRMDGRDLLEDAFRPVIAHNERAAAEIEKMDVIGKPLESKNANSAMYPAWLQVYLNEGKMAPVSPKLECGEADIGACAKPGSEEAKKALAEYKALPADEKTDCMIGGSFSVFDGQPAADNCRPFQSLGDLPSAKTLCAPVLVAEAKSETKTDAAPSAPSGMQQICPIGMFCKADGAALCASADGDVAANCQAAQGKIGQLDCFALAKVENGFGLAEEWDKYRKKLWDRCMKPLGGAPVGRDQKFRKAFCSDCRSATRSIALLNKAVTGNACGDISGDNFKADDLKGKSKPTTVQ